MPGTKDDAHMHRKINQNEIADPKILKLTILQAFFYLEKHHRSR
jgi:hypothetical protein